MNVLRKLAAGAMTNHWFCTIATLVYLSAFVASLMGVLPVMTIRGAWVMNPWFLGPATIMFLIAAVESWRIRWAMPPISSDYWVRMREIRLAEITNWLQKPISVNEAPAEARPHLEQWCQTVALQGDEVWFCDNGEEAWNNLAGENGFALLRRGRVVEFMTWEMN